MCAARHTLQQLGKDGMAEGRRRHDIVSGTLTCLEFCREICETQHAQRRFVVHEHRHGFTPRSEVMEAVLSLSGFCAGPRCQRTRSRKTLADFEEQVKVCDVGGCLPRLCPRDAQRAH